MSTKFKSIIKYQWVNILPTFISASLVLIFLGSLDLFPLYLPMCLGLIAGGVVDVDNKFSGKVKNAFLIFIIFLIAETIVLYTFHNFILLWISSIITAFVFVMSGAFSKSLKTVGFGGVLIICYSMFLCFHATDFTMAVEHLLYMLVAAMFYTGISLLIHVLFPNRGIKNNVSDLYNALSDFLSIKGSFFDPDDETYRREFTSPDKENGGELIANNYYNKHYEKARNHLIEQFELTKASLIIRIKSFGKRKTTSDMMRYYLTADNIFKTLDFNLQDYQPLKDRLQDSDIMFRIQRILMLYATAASQFSYDLTSERMVALDKRILVSIERLEASINKQRALHYYHVDSLQLLLTKLKKVYWLLQNINNEESFKQNVQQFTPEHHAKVSFKLKLQTALNDFSLKSPIMRHAIRVCMLLLMSGFVFYFLSLQFAFWFMMAGVLVIQPRYSLTKTRVKHRVYGSIFGALAGACLAFPVDTMPVELCIAGITTLTLFQVTKVLNYGYSTFFLTMAVFCTFRTAGLELTPMVVFERILANTLGAALCYLVMSYVLPEWKYLNLGKNVRQVYDYNKRLLLSLVGVLLKHPISAFDLNKRFLIAQNSHISLQSVVSSIVSEPKIYRLYITPSIKLMALNDYILSNLSLINQLLIEAMEGNKLEEIDAQTITLFERLALIYSNLYAYGDDELRVTVGKFIAEANEVANQHEDKDESFNLNFYLNEKIVGIAVALINYRRELALIYQLTKIDQKLFEKVKDKKQTSSESIAKNTSEVANAVATAKVLDNEVMAKTVAKAEAQARKEQVEEVLATEKKADQEIEDKLVASAVRLDHESVVASEQLTAQTSKKEQIAQAQAQHEIQTNAYISQAAQNSIADIESGANSEQVEKIIAHRLGQENLGFETTSASNLVREEVPEEVETQVPVPELNPEQVQKDLAIQAQVDKEKTEALVDAELAKIPKTEDDVLVDFLTSQEVQMTKQVEQDVFWHDTADEIARVEQEQSSKEQEAQALAMADKLTQETLNKQFNQK
ncbi:FUSC family membrane protein [Psittacicella gerlachiana]|uniref:Uncharacterized protein n=1 Tax=Psittacicella gerlachiana TaxID=2028574 RepID=A0A3A1YAG5_9GAMM|nr:FUSC family membrane protein [Psittacicella gerlachiana]RIY35132.1 hypothetical protein CKF59_04095 [Psittacicella gerlachiana]